MDKFSKPKRSLVGTFVVDSALRIQLVDTAAESILSSNDGLFLSAGNILTFDVKERHVKFLELVNKASNETSQSHKMLVLRPSGKLPYLLDISYSSWSSPRQNTLIFDVSINDLEFDVSVPVELLEVYHLFTKRECEVAYLLVNGSDLEEIANRLNIKLITIRQYVKAMMKKTQTQTRSDLVRLIMLTSFRFSA